MRLFRLMYLVCVVGVLAACGSSTASMPTAAPAEPTSGRPPAQTSGSMPQPTQAQQALPTSPARPTTAAASSTFEGIPTSRTAEGYHVLGDPNAPKTIEFYSDFL